MRAQDVNTPHLFKGSACVCPFFFLLQNGQPKAYFYLDPYSRPAEKRGGAWMAEVVGQVRLQISAPNVNKP